jgi:hypothetical protein
MTMPWTSRYPSAARLRDRLAASGDPLRTYTAEALYRIQVDYTCQLLDVVDEVVDQVTAQLITDAIYERLSGEGVSEAARRIREARAEMERLARRIPDARAEFAREAAEAAAAVVPKGGQR